MISPHFEVTSFKLFLDKHFYLDKRIKNDRKHWVCPSSIERFITLMEHKGFDESMVDASNLNTEFYIVPSEYENLIENSKTFTLRNGYRDALQFVCDQTLIAALVNELRMVSSKEYFLEVKFKDFHIFGMCEHVFTMGNYTRTTEPKLLRFPNAQTESTEFMLAPNIFKIGKDINLCDMASCSLKGLEVPIGESVKVTSIIFGDKTTEVPSYQLDISKLPRTTFLWRESCNSAYEARMYDETKFYFSELRPFDPSIPKLPMAHNAKLNIHGELNRETGKINVTVYMYDVSESLPLMHPIGYTLECYSNI